MSLLFLAVGGIFFVGPAGGKRAARAELPLEFVHPPSRPMVASTFFFIRVGVLTSAVKQVTFTLQNQERVWEFAGEYVPELALYKFFWEVSDFPDDSYVVRASVATTDDRHAAVAHAVVLRRDRSEKTPPVLGTPTTIPPPPVGTAPGGGKAPLAVTAAAPQPEIRMREPEAGSRWATSVRLSAESSQPLDSLEFWLDNLATQAQRDAQFPGAPSADRPARWEYFLESTQLPPGTYLVGAGGRINGRLVESREVVRFTLLSSRLTSVTPLAVSFRNPPSSPIVAPVYFFVAVGTPFEHISQVTLRVAGDSVGRVFSGEPIAELQLYKFYWDTADFPAGSYVISAVAETTDGQRASAELLVVLTRLAAAAEVMSAPVPQPETPPPTALPAEVTAPVASVPAALVNESLPLPPADQTVATVPLPPTSTPSVVASERAPELPPAPAGDSLTAQPPAVVAHDVRCTVRGITEVERCASMIERLEEKALPVECQAAQIYHPEACRRHLLTRPDRPAPKSLPEACRHHGIEDRELCLQYLNVLEVSAPCRVKGVTTREACDQLIVQQYLEPACQRAGIADPAVCRRDLTDQVALAVTCDLVDAATCRGVVVARHLPAVLMAQERLQRLQSVVHAHGQAPTVLQPSQQTPVHEREQITALEQVVPLALPQPLPVSLLSSVPRVVIREDETLAVAAPAVVVLDRDGDGLPDDVEERLGSDAAVADTDRDGVSDRQEVAAGSNPLGAGASALSVAPVEYALAIGRPLEQPIALPEPSASLTVTAVVNADSTQRQAQPQAGLHFFGRGRPGEVITLFIYSSLPLVVTTRVNADGNWTYRLRQSLVDGPHEVYVTVNDGTGQAIARSAPLRFLIRQARAIGPAQAISQPPTPPAFPRARLYLPLVGLVVFVGLLLLLVFSPAHRGRRPPV